MSVLVNKIHYGDYYPGSSRFVWVVEGIVDWYYFPSLASASAFSYFVCATPLGRKSPIFYEMSQSAFFIKFAMKIKNFVIFH